MKRREFLILSSTVFLSASFTASGIAARGRDEVLAAEAGDRAGASGERQHLTLFLAGDVMMGRGIDQILPHSVDPRLHEPYVKSAVTYLKLAEVKHGRIPAEVSYAYIWGDALDELARVGPDARIINLETAVTTSEDWWRRKGIHYRMHPENVRVLTTADIDICVLGNNHVMDWGREGLRETLTALQGAGLRTSGAGMDRMAAAAPAALNTGTGRLLVFSYGSPGAGIPREWGAKEDRPGVNLLPDLSRQGARQVIENVRAYRRAGDRVVISLHWGENWGYRVPGSQRDFAHRLVDAGAADIIHGHSSHHPKGVEVYRGRPILYGAGDFLNDYEGIGGKEKFRGDLSLMYFPRIDGSGALVSLEITPMRIRRFRLERAAEKDRRWLAERLDRESRKFGTRVEETSQGRLALGWSKKY